MGSISLRERRVLWLRDVKCAARNCDVCLRLQLGMSPPLLHYWARLHHVVQQEIVRVIFGLTRVLEFISLTLSCADMEFTPNNVKAIYLERLCI